MRSYIEGRTEGPGNSGIEGRTHQKVHGQVHASHGSGSTSQLWPEGTNIFDLFGPLSANSKSNFDLHKGLSLTCLDLCVPILKQSQVTNLSCVSSFHFQTCQFQSEKSSRFKLAFLPLSKCPKVCMSYLLGEFPSLICQFRSWKVNIALVESSLEGKYSWAWSRARARLLSLATGSTLRQALNSDFNLARSTL